jgi:hypothetical protein
LFCDWYRMFILLENLFFWIYRIRVENAQGWIYSPPG